MRYYKVVRMEGGQLWSAGVRDELQCEYIPGQWTVAPVGGLLVFRSQKDARRWIRKCGSANAFQIWLADCEDPVSLPAVGLGYPWIRRAAEYVWATGLVPLHTEGWLNYQSYILYSDWPAGTLAFRKVRLIRLIRECKRTRIDRALARLLDATA
jgi:hypothetical protein